MKKQKKWFKPKRQIGVLLLAISLLTSLSCQQQEQEKKQKQEEKVSQVAHPEWSKNANIYEVNIRQYTRAGTFDAFAEHLPRLKEMGVDILWIMPIHPIGEKNRKGELGSYYSVKDYYGVNPRFGTMEDFKSLVNKAHQMDMKVILDWVANHTAWDNPLIDEHPDWYLKDSLGNIKAPVEDWSDVAGLNYEVPAVRDYMVEAMKYWVKEANIDGYRCDVAHMVPIDFWSRVHQELDQIKDVFMLAEAEGPEYHQAFDMSYAWELHHLMNQVARGEEEVPVLDKYLEKEKQNYPDNAYRLNFTSNHDENSWQGTVYERMGAGAKTFTVFTYTFPGMPLIYSGQEACMDKRLEFFTQDVIDWNKKDCDMQSFYTELNKLKENNETLWNGTFGGETNRISTSRDTDIFAFTREEGENKTFVVLNFSDQELSVEFNGDTYTGSYTNVLNGQDKSFQAGATLEMKPWGYKVYEEN
ncbi:MAG TPA: alpha-amylase family glycosyl hydrolase [Bacteroidales bacterium]|nr:alpha-amylase family glycosyl hydrolase [Bacteroidales bacterium]